MNPSACPVGIIGVGHMGGAMALRLCSLGAVSIKEDAFRLDTRLHPSAKSVGVGAL